MLFAINLSLLYDNISSLLLLQVIWPSPNSLALQFDSRNRTAYAAPSHWIAAKLSSRCNWNLRENPWRGARHSATCSTSRWIVFTHTSAFLWIFICISTRRSPSRNRTRSSAATTRYFHRHGFILEFFGLRFSECVRHQHHKRHWNSMRAVTNLFAWFGLAWLQSNRASNTNAFVGRAHTHLRRFMCLCVAAIIVYALASNHSTGITNRYQSGH